MAKPQQSGWRTIGASLKKSMKVLFSGYGGQTAGEYGGYGSGFGGLWPFFPNSRYDYVREVGELWLNSAVYASVAWIQRNFIEAHMGVYERDIEGNRIEIREHPFRRTWRRPNPYYTGRDLWKGVLLSLKLNGNGYVLKGRNDEGRGWPVEYWWVPHWMMTPQWPVDGSKWISHYLYTVNGRHVPVPVGDVIHFRDGFDPMNPRLGLSPLAACLREICTDNECNNYAASLMRNMGIPGLVISPKNDVALIGFGEEQTVKAKFETHFSGDERGKPLVNTVPIDVQMPGFNPDQMALEVMRKVPEERITACLGVPAAVVGLGAGLENSTFNNLKELRQAAYENTIIPLQGEVAHQLDFQGLEDFRRSEGEFVGWDYSEVRVLQEDENKKAERLGDLFKDGLLKRGEARADLGYKKTAEDDLYFTDIDRQNQIDVAKAQTANRPLAGASN